MKRYLTKAPKVVALLTVALFLSACGGSDSGKTNWGIDHGTVPKCSADERDASVALQVPAGTVINALTEDAKVRVWHYSNSDKLVCVISGSVSVGEN